MRHKLKGPQSISNEKKYKLCQQHFGIQAYPLTADHQFNEKKALKKWKKLRSNNNVISHNYERLKKIIMVLSKSNENDKRNQKDLEMIEPLLSELKFFKQTMKMKTEEIVELCRAVQYEYKEPG